MTPNRDEHSAISTPTIKAFFPRIAKELGVKEITGLYSVRQDKDLYIFYDSFIAPKYSLAALKKIRWLDIDFGQVEVYTYRELKDGSLSLSRPCESCLAFMKQLGIKRICYTTPDGYAEERLIY